MSPGPFFPDIPEPPRRPRFSPELSRRMSEAAIRAKAARQLDAWWSGLAGYLLLAGGVLIQVLTWGGTIEWFQPILWAWAATVLVILKTWRIRRTLQNQLQEDPDGQV